VTVINNFIINGTADNGFFVTKVHYILYFQPTRVGNPLLVEFTSSIVIVTWSCSAFVNLIALMMMSE